MKKRSVRVCCISDMHGAFKMLKLPAADIIVCTGDATAQGYKYEYELFLKWFSSLTQYYKRIVIAGNHDLSCEDYPKETLNMIPKNVDYLLDSSIIFRNIKIYGTPYQPIFLDWAFNLPESELEKVWSKIPEDVDILLTHCPPYGIMDWVGPWRNKPGKHVGSPSLTENVLKRIKPRLHVFGHIHENYGTEIIENIIFENASVMNGQYYLTNDPILIDIEK